MPFPYKRFHSCCVKLGFFSPDLDLGVVILKNFGR